MPKVILLSMEGSLLGGECTRFLRLGHSSRCQLQGRLLLLLQLQARVSRARGEAEQGEADWGEGERAPVANETYRFGLRENKFSFAGA